MCRVAHRILAPVALMMLLIGCSDEGKKIVEVHGTVTRGGEPVPNVTLNFVPTNGRPSWGASDEKGEFTLSYDPERDGAEVGTHKVYVEFRVNSPEEEHLRSIGRWKIPPDEKEILEKYGDPDNPAITVEVTDSGEPIEIKLD